MPALVDDDVRSVVRPGNSDIITKSDSMPHLSAVNGHAIIRKCSEGGGYGKVCSLRGHDIDEVILGIVYIRIRYFDSILDVRVVLLKGNAISKPIFKR